MIRAGAFVWSGMIMRYIHFYLNHKKWLTYGKKSLFLSAKIDKKPFGLWRFLPKFLICSVKYGQNLKTMI